MCAECGSWGDHFRAQHPTQDQVQSNDATVEEGMVASGAIAQEDLCQEIDDGANDVSDGAFARLRLAGLL